MCSQPSRRSSPSPREHVGALASALVTVAQESYFSFAEPCGAGPFNAALEALGTEAPDRPGRWLRAHVDFDGAFAGSVALTLPYPLAVDLATAMAGTAPGADVPESDVFDSTGEFANMVCGTWLTHACARRRFDLRPPCVQEAAAESGCAEPGDSTQLLLINDRPLSLTVLFHQA